MSRFLDMTGKNIISMMKRHFDDRRNLIIIYSKKMITDVSLLRHDGQEHHYDVETSFRR